MRVDFATQNVVSNGVLASQAMSVNADDPIFWMAMKETLYSKSRWILEAAQNARDADKNWKLVLPTHLNPFVEFIDNGPSMTKEFMLTTYCSAFTSTKRGDNTKSGGWGLGRLSYPQGTMLVCRNPDMIRTYAYHDNENHIPAITLMSEEVRPSDVPVGTTVRVPVVPSDFRRVTDDAKRLLLFFNLPNFPEPEFAILKDGEWALRRKRSTSYGDTTNRPLVIMGGYPFHVTLDDIPYDKRSSFTRAVFDADSGYIVWVPVGSCDVGLSRESLRFTEKTLKTLNDAAKLVCDDLPSHYQHHFDGCKTLWEATETYQDIVEEAPHAVQTLLRGKLKWQGKSIGSNIEVDFNNDFPHIDVADIRNQKTRSYGVPSKLKWHQLFGREFIKVSDSVMIVHEDVEKRNKQAILRHAANSNSVIYLIGQKANLQDVLDKFGNPPTVLKLSEMQEPPKDTTTRSRRTVTGLKVFDGYHNEWENFTEVLPEEVVYVPLMNNEPDGMNNFYLLKGCSYAPKTIIGVPKSCRSKIEDDWIRLDDYIKARLPDLSDIDYRYDQYTKAREIHSRHLANLFERLPNRPTSASHIVNRFMIESQAVDKLNGIQLATDQQLATIFKVEQTKEKDPICALAVLRDELLAAYPMLRFVGSYPSDKDLAIVAAYING